MKDGHIIEQGDHEKVKEMSRETAIVPERPGIAPTQMPAKTPAQTRAITCQSMKGIKKY